MNRFLTAFFLLAGLLGSPLVSDAAVQGRKKGQDKDKKEKKEKPGKGAGVKPKDKHPGGHPGRGKGPKHAGKGGTTVQDCKRGADLNSVLSALREFHQGKQLETVQRVMREHYTRGHPGQTCHCSCGHPKTVGRVKGNNGVGNGIDPQPPGNPPVNDGPGTGPGNPGSKKGKGKGPAPRGKGKK